jgi:hypothetical protein
MADTGSDPVKGKEEGGVPAAPRARPLQTRGQSSVGGARDEGPPTPAAPRRRRSIAARLVARAQRLDRHGGSRLAAAVTERRLALPAALAPRLAPPREEGSRRATGSGRRPSPPGAPLASAAAEPTYPRPAGMSEFAAQWLFGDGPTEGTPFAGGSALGAQTSGPPAFLAARRAAVDAAAERKARTLSRTAAPRGRVHEERPLRLSATPPPRGEEPPAQSSPPEPEAAPAPPSAPAAPLPPSEPVSPPPSGARPLARSPREPAPPAPPAPAEAAGAPLEEPRSPGESAAGRGEASAPRSPTVVRPRRPETPPAPPRRAPVALQRVARPPAAPPPVPQVPTAAPPRGLLRRVADRLVGAGRAQRTAAGAEPSEGTGPGVGTELGPAGRVGSRSTVAASASAPAPVRMAESLARAPSDGAAQTAPSTPGDAEPRLAEAAEPGFDSPADSAPTEPAVPGGVTAGPAPSEATVAPLGFGPPVQGSGDPASREPPGPGTGGAGEAAVAPASSGLRRALARLRTRGTPSPAALDRGPAPARAQGAMRGAGSEGTADFAGGPPTATSAPAQTGTRAAGDPRPAMAAGEQTGAAVTPAAVTPATTRATVHRSPSATPSVLTPDAGGASLSAAPESGGGEHGPPSPLAAAGPGGHGTGPAAPTARAARAAQPSARPPVRLRRAPARTFSAPSSSSQRVGRVPGSPVPGARTSGERLADATGAALRRDVGAGVETIEFPVGGSDSGPGLESVLAREPAGGGPSGPTPGAQPAAGGAAAPGAAAAPGGEGGTASPGGAPSSVAGASSEADDMYEHVIERLRRDLLTERERMGDLLGDLS